MTWVHQGDRMTVLAEQSIISAEQFEALPNSDDYELIDGQLRERKAMGAGSSRVAALVSRLILNHVLAAQSGHVFDSSTTYRCFDNPDTLRRADVSFIRHQRMPEVPVGVINISPDLVVEVISPNDLAYEVNEKVEQYLAAGVPLVWVIYPNTRTVQVHHKDGRIADLRQDQTISGEDVLPGFACSISEFFPPPAAAVSQQT
jgi:Uma2 family endonuclease